MAKNELPILIAATENFVKNRKKPTLFYVPTVYTGTKMFLGDPWAVFVNHHMGSASKYVAILKTLRSHTRTTKIASLKRFSAVCMCLTMTREKRILLGRLILKVVGGRPSETCVRYSGTFISHSRRLWDLERLLTRLGALLESAGEDFRETMLKKEI